MLKLSPTRTIIRGDSDRFKLTFVKTASNNKTTPIDITGWTIRYTVRNAVPANTVVTDTDALISAEATITNATEGIAEVFVEGDKTTVITPGEYLYDIQVIRPEDELGRRQITSTRRGKYIVLGDITRKETIDEEVVSEDDADDGYEI